MGWGLGAEIEVGSTGFSEWSGNHSGCYSGQISACPVQPIQMNRVAGLLKGEIQWEPNAFAVLTDAELADFDGAGLLPVTSPAADSL